MKQTINFSQFCDAFRDMNREDQFTYDAKKALFDFIEELDDQCETETELDVIALCCEFSEYESAIECVDTCGYPSGLDDDDEALTDADREEFVLDYLRDNTFVIEFTGGIIIQDF